MGVMARLTRFDIPVNIAKRRRAMEKQTMTMKTRGKRHRRSRGKSYSRERKRRDRDRARECRKNGQMLRFTEGKIARDTKNEKRKGDEWTKKRESE